MYVASAQTWEDPGPHLVGRRDIVFFEPGLGDIDGRIYYPATAAGFDTPPDPSGGPYPLHGFMHMLGEVDPKEVHIGMNVKAVWKPPEAREGSVTDILYFKPVDK